MSCFSGKMKEYPSLSVDCFNKDNLGSRAFFLSHCHRDHMEGLDSPAFANRLKGSSDVFIYCSETTLNLLLCNPSYTHLKSYLKGIPIDQPYLVSIPDEQTRQDEAVTVTLLSAGHCVGSVMFFFEGKNGNVLYTGDFRLSKGDVQRIKFFHSSGCVKDIKSVYVDTTFCLPQMMSIPSRKETKDAIIRVIDKWLCRGPHHMVSLQCKGMYGYEYLLKELAQHYKTKIHISKERLALYHYLTDMKQYFTTDPKNTKIHSCKWDKTPKDECSSLPCGFILPNGSVPKVIRIKPTSLWFARHTKPLPADCTRYVKDKKTWRVVHSMHASMEEIIDLVSYLRPYHVYPNVEPAGLYTLDDATSWLKEYTRMDECDSCNEEDSGDTNFRAQASEFKVSAVHKVKHTESNSLPSKQRPPSQSVTKVYKDLDLEDDASLAPMPIKRRRRIKNSHSNTDANSKEEKISLINSDSGSLDRNNKYEEQSYESKGREVHRIDSKLKDNKSFNPSQECDELVQCHQNIVQLSNPNTASKDVLTNDHEEILQHSKPQNATEIAFGTSPLTDERIVSKSEDDASHKHILTDAAESNIKEKDLSLLDIKIISSISSVSSSEPDSNVVSDEFFNIPASPGTQVPSKEVLADLHKCIKNGELFNSHNLF